MDRKKKEKKNQNSNISSDFQTPVKKQKKKKENEKPPSESSDRETDGCLESKPDEPIRDMDAKKECPSCLQNVRISVFQSHVIHCLKKFRRDFEPKAGPSHGTGLSELACGICKKDLKHLNEYRRAKHQNKCLDLLEETDDCSSSSSSSSSSPVLNCPICSFQPSSQQTRSSHLKQCAKKRGIASTNLFEIVQLQKRQAQERKAVGLSEMPPPLKRAVPKTRSRRTTQRRHENSEPEEEPAVSEDMQLAMAMSLSTSQEKQGIDFSEPYSHKRQKGENRVAELLLALGHTAEPTKKCSKKRRNKNERKETPLLLLRSNEDRMTIVTGRIEKILENQSHFADDYCPPSATNWSKMPPHTSRLKQTPECRLWQLASLSSELTSDPAVFYVKELRPFVSPCKLKPGSKLKRLSQIPGYRTLTQSVNEEAVVEDVADENDDRIPCTLDVFRKLAHECSDADQFPSQGFIASGNEEECGDVVATEDEPQVHGVTSEIQSIPGFLKMVANESLSDCKIELDDGISIPCHRFVLYANCQIAFNELDDEGILRWDGISRKTAVSFLQFLYGGTITESGYSMSELKSLSDRYDLVDDVAKVGRLSPKEQSRVDDDESDGRANDEDVAVDDGIIRLSGKQSCSDISSSSQRKKVVLEFVKSPSVGSASKESSTAKSALDCQQSKEGTSNCVPTLSQMNSNHYRRVLHFGTEEMGRNDSMNMSDCLKEISVAGNSRNRNQLSPSLFDEPFEDDDLFDNVDLAGLSQERDVVNENRDHRSKRDSPCEPKTQQQQEKTPTVTSTTRFQNFQLKDASTSTPNDVVGSYAAHCHCVTPLNISPVCRPSVSNLNITTDKREGSFVIPIASRATPSPFKKPIGFALPSSSRYENESIPICSPNASNSKLIVAPITDSPPKVWDVVSESSLDGVIDNDDDRGDGGIVIDSWKEKVSSQQNRGDGDFCSQTHKEPNNDDSSQTHKKRKLAQNPDISGSSDSFWPTRSLKKKRLDFEKDEEQFESQGFVLDSINDKRNASNDNIWENFHDDDYYDCRPNMTATDSVLRTREQSTPHVKNKSVTFCDRIQVLPLSQSLLSGGSLPDISTAATKDTHTCEANVVSPTTGSERTRKKAKLKKKEKKKTKKVKKRDETSVTPLLHYSVMPTPEVNKALSKIGVKTMPKKKASKLLKHVYYETHPLVSSDESRDSSVNTAPEMSLKGTEETPRKKNRKKLLDRSLSSEKIREFIESHVYWYEEMTEYKVIDLQALMIDMSSAELKISLKKLKRYLDEECITYTETRVASPRKKKNKNKQ